MQHVPQYTPVTQPETLSGAGTWTQRWKMWIEKQNIFIEWYHSCTQQHEARRYKDIYVAMKIFCVWSLVF